MKFTIENLGKIDYAELDLAGLTMICGENNTGKTYVMYAVYGFLRRLPDYLTRIFEDYFKAQHWPAGQPIEIGLQELFIDRLDEWLARASVMFVQDLPAVFACDAQRFEKVVFRAKIAEAPDLAIRMAGLETVFMTEINVHFRYEPRPFAVLGLKSFGDPLATSSEAAKVLAWVLIWHVLQITVRLFSSERSGIMQFYRELDYARSKFISRLQADPQAELSSPIMQARYPQAVTDEINFVRMAPPIKIQGELVKSDPALLQCFVQIAGGAYQSSAEQGIRYTPQGVRQDMSLAEASSAVRALADFDIYLKSFARPGDLLMIDEPELNLHPRNQRRFARLLARLVNAGVRVMLSTHSDYLVKEVNTLIMLAQDTPHARQMREKFGYAEQELLQPDSVHLYVAGPGKVKGRRKRINTLTLAPVDPARGIAVSSFDSEIDDLNRIQEEILFGGEL
ncbi:AAA family ATPase [Massilia sp. W12]|uniref:AAA family ATPase n=1 Tax=Massilia sp. W12 TaxID=3126507 RepID=UPI0030CAF74D